MLQTIEFFSTTDKKLPEKINEFIRENPQLKIVDINYSSYSDYFNNDCSSALIVYDDAKTTEKK